MSLHIIIEGSDKVGKSTVCEMLSRWLQMQVIKMQDMPKFFATGHQEEASEIFNKALVQFSHTAFIMDRGYPSSIVYSKFFNRQYDLSYLDDIIRKLDARVYVLSVQPRTHDNILNDSQQFKIRELYDEYARKFNWKKINCEGLTPAQICEEIIKDLNVWTKTRSLS